MSTTTRDALIAQAETARRSFQRRLSEIRGDRDLSAEAKRREISTLYGDTAAMVRALRRQHDELAASEREALVKAAFGPFIAAGATAGDRETALMSYRAALAQVEGVRDLAQVERLLQRARMAGDRQLERAIGLTAYERGQVRILDQLDSEDVTALRQLDAERGRVQVRFSESVAFTVPARPAEAAPALED